MDDFLLPKELITPDRLNEIAGNFHYERFQKEIIDGIKNTEDKADIVINTSNSIV